MLKIEHLDLAYADGVPVLKGINLTIHPGECILFTGSSGSGKSSIINAMNGLAVLYDGAMVHGHIYLNGKAIHKFKPYEIAMYISNVFQNPKTHFFNVNTTLELLFYLENLGLDREAMNARMQQMLTLFPIEHLLNRDIFRLSGGEKQILCVASCYMAGTEVILLDEPSSNLDERCIDMLHEMLYLLKKQGITLVLSEHRIYYLMDLVDRVLVLKNGMISGAYSAMSFKALADEKGYALGLRSMNKPVLKSFSKENVGELLIRVMDVPLPETRHFLTIRDTYFQQGKIYGIIGFNGCGKSTFVRALIGIEKRVKDEIYFKGKKISKRERLKRSALVMQDVNCQLFSGEVAGEITLGDKHPDQDKADELLQSLDLYAQRDRHPFSLSGGQKQRVAIASVLYQDANFIFFDEPTSGMDFINMERISILIKEASRKDNIIFIISHDIEFLNKTVDAVLDMTDYRC